MRWLTHRWCPWFLMLHRFLSLSFPNHDVYVSSLCNVSCFSMTPAVSLLSKLKLVSCIPNITHIFQFSPMRIFTGYLIHLKSFHPWTYLTCLFGAKWYLLVLNIIQSIFLCSPGFHFVWDYGITEKNPILCYPRMTNFPFLQ